MAIGALIALMLLAKLVDRGWWIYTGHPAWAFLNHEHPLTIVGKGLAYSAGIELAYMLFTPGPDEAVEPVILGVASATLLVVSDDLSLHTAGIVLALTVGIATLAETYA